MLHDADPANPGLLELIDVCRLEAPGTHVVRSLLTGIPNRSYDLLPGLRRRRLWTQLRPSSSLEALNALRRSYDAIVADLDGDLEGEAESGSIDVEDRHQLTRLANVVLAVGHSSMKGAHSLTRIIREVVEFGVDPTVIQPVFNHAAPGARARAGYSAALAQLCVGLDLTCSPVFIPTRDIDDRLRALTPFPGAIVDPLAGALAARISPPTVSGDRSDSTFAWRRFGRRMATS
jgi:hypothetical protein